MPRNLMPSFALALAVAGVAIAAVQSGLQVGERAGSFNVKDVTGPNSGKTLCYRCFYGSRPCVAIFSREITDNLASLVKQVDEQVDKNQDKYMCAFFVLLAEDKDAAAGKLQELAKKHDIKNVPLTVFDDAGGPPEYKIAKDAEVTVLLLRKDAVAANHSFGKGQLDKKGIDGIVADTSKVLE
jgi:hypothetical protein